MTPAGLPLVGIRAAAAAAGFALAGGGVLALLRPQPIGVGRRAERHGHAADGVPGVPARPHALLRLAGAAGAVVALLAPIASRSAVLRRGSADAVSRRRMAIAGSSSWVAVACVGAAARQAGRSAPDQEPAGGAAVLDALAGLRLTAGGCVLAGGVCLMPLFGAAAMVIAAALALPALTAPDLLLAAHSRRSAAAASTALPEALELLAACCRGGLPLEAALEVAVHHTVDPVRGVLARARRRQVAGQNPATALRVEAELVGIDELVALGRLVDRHHQLGLPLEAPLLARAAAARSRAHTEALDRAGRAVPLASLVTAMVVAPCCVAMLALWVIAATVARSGLL